MYFIHITTHTDIKDFTSWLDGKNKLAFNDSQNFITWLEGRNVFPIEIYIDGMTIRFNSQKEINMFRIGLDLGINLRINNDFK